MGELMSSSKKMFEYDEGLTDYANKYKKTIQCEVLQELREEIEKCADSYYEGQFRQGLCKALKILDIKIKELSE